MKLDLLVPAFMNLLPPLATALEVASRRLSAHEATFLGNSWRKFERTMTR
jgi:hypothetical protein